MEEKKNREPNDPEQSARFIELAEQIQTEDAEERFEEAMERIGKVKRPKSTETGDGKTEPKVINAMQQNPQQKP